MPPEPALSLHALSKYFRVARAADDCDPRRERDGRRDRFWALREVSFDVAPGETLGLIGSNGSGKSTLLKILSGVMAPGGGHFEARGRIGALLELGAGFHPDLTGVENVYLNGALLGLSTREIDSILPEIIAFAELERFMDMPVRHFSSGMSSRLGFSVATRLSPEILLMDETFAAGDAHFRSRALAHVASMKQRGHTLMIVSHNLEIVLTLCDRVAWLDRGRLRGLGSPPEIIGEYQRSQQLALHDAGNVRGALGMQSVFASALGESAPVRIGQARLGRPDGTAADELALAAGEGAALDLTLEHPGPGAPERVVVETAWVRDDHRIVAQGRSPLALAGGGATRCRLAWEPWRLFEGVYRLAVAISPAGGGVVGDPAGGAAALHYDRRLEVGTIRVTTPDTREIKALTHLPYHWET